jgi:hypothetical protein
LHSEKDCQSRAEKLMKSRTCFALPLLLLPIMAGIFALSARWLGAEAGYLLGFGFYWLFWCLLAPRWVLGKAEFAALLRDRAPLFDRANRLAALLWLTVTLVSVWMYAGEFLRAPLILILLAAPLATLNGFCEEILWRGLYVPRSASPSGILPRR